MAFELKLYRRSDFSPFLSVADRKKMEKALLQHHSEFINLTLHSIKRNRNRKQSNGGDVDAKSGYGHGLGLVWPAHGWT